MGSSYRGFHPECRRLDIGSVPKRAATRTKSQASRCANMTQRLRATKDPREPPRGATLSRTQRDVARSSGKSNAAEVRLHMITEDLKYRSTTRWGLHLRARTERSHQGSRVHSDGRTCVVEETRGVATAECTRTITLHKTFTVCLTHLHAYSVQPSHTQTKVFQAHTFQRPGHTCSCRSCRWADESGTRES